MSDKNTMVGGLYRCTDCDTCFPITEIQHLLQMDAHMVNPVSFVARCPNCYEMGAISIHGARKTNIFERMGVWATLKYVVKNTWREATEDRK